MKDQLDFLIIGYIFFLPGSTIEKHFIIIFLSYISGFCDGSKVKRKKPVHQPGL
jgi:hypothetical protein